jgi:chromosomal replication initiator protein
MVTIWDEARHLLRAELGAMFDIWIAPVRLHGVEAAAPGAPPTASRRVHLVAPHALFRTRIEQTYAAAVASALSDALECTAQVEVWIEGDSLPNLDGPAEPKTGEAENQPSLPALPVLSAEAPTVLAVVPEPEPMRRRPRRGASEDEAYFATAARQAPTWDEPPPQARLFPEPLRAPPAAEAPPADPPNDSVLPSGKTFEHFVVGACNQFAHAAARAVADDITSVRYNPLFIYGGTGLGKTHLMVSVGHHRLAVSPGTRVLYVTAEQFTNELIESLRFKRMTEFRQKYRHNVDLLLMDDVQFVTGKERTQEELFHTFEWLRERGRQIVFTADVLPREIRGFEPRLRTRCESGMLADMQPPDLETLVAILHEKSEACGQPLPSEVAAYIASRVRGSIREIEGVVHRLDALASLYRQPPSLPFVRAHLGHVLPDGPPAPEPDDILREVANAFSVQVAQLLGRQRVRRLVRPRHVAMFLVRKHTGASFPEIGRRFRRDHTTVQHACRKIEAALMTDIELRQVVHGIERSIGC